MPVHLGYGQRCVEAQVLECCGVGQRYLFWLETHLKVRNASQPADFVAEEHLNDEVVGTLAYQTLDSTHNCTAVGSLLTDMFTEFRRNAAPDSRRHIT